MCFPQARSPSSQGWVQLGASERVPKAYEASIRPVAHVTAGSATLLRVGVVKPNIPPAPPMAAGPPTSEPSAFNAVVTHKSAGVAAPGPLCGNFDIILKLLF